VIQTFILRRALLFIGIVLITTLILAPLLIGWSVLYTTAGAQFVVRHLPRHMAGITLDIVGLTGTVADGLHVERVEIDHELVHLKFTDIAGRAALAPLLLQTIRVPHASIASAEITVKRRVHPPTPSPPGFLPRWLLISAEDMQVKQVTLSVYNGAHLEVTDLSGAAVLRHATIRLFQATGLMEGAHVSATGELLAQDPLGLQAKAHLDWHPAGQPAYVLDGIARGDLNRLSVVARTESPFRADVTGQLLDLTGHLHWLASLFVHQLDLKAWGVSAPLGDISARLSAVGDLDTFTAKGPVNPMGLRAGVFDLQFEGGFAQHTLSARRVDVRHVDSGARAQASGTIAIVDNGPRLDLKGSWNEFRWPLVGREPGVRSASGTFTLEGVLPYNVHVVGDAHVAQLPVMPVDVSGRLGKDSFEFDRAEVDLYGGHTSASGKVNWAQETYAVSGRATGMDPSQLRPDLPGSLNFDYTVSGKGFAANGDLAVAFSGLSGKLRGASASGAGALAHAGKTWAFNALHVALGTTSLALDGQIDDLLKLRFALSTQDLNLLSPGSRGQLKAQGTLGGTFEDPAVVGNVHAVDIDYAGIKIKGVDADIDFEPDAASKESKVDVRLHALSLRQRTLDAATFTLTGPPSNYVVHLTATAPGLSASVQTRGAYTARSYRGQLTGLALNGNEALHLTLDRPVDFVASLEHVRLEWMCLVGSPGSVCADGDWTPQAWATTIMTNELPLNTFTAGMTPSVQYLGTIDALARLGDSGHGVQGTLKAQLTDAEIAHRLASKKIEHTRIGSGSLNVQLGAQVITAQADLGDGQVGTMQASFSAQRTTPAFLDMPLSGQIHAQSADVDLISLYIPDIDRAAGHFNVDIQVAGTLGAPRLSGAVKVSAGEIDVYQVNLALREIALEAQLSDAGLNFKGSARAGNGTVSADGHVEWRELLPYGKFHLRGTNLRVADIPEAVIDASPDLDFTITGRKIQVTGKVLVPYAKIQPKDITNAVRPSDDEIIVGTEVDDPNKRFEVSTEVTLTLGDKVSIDAMGLTARLGGNVTVTSAGGDAITRGVGAVNILDGKYAAYARQLDIDSGALSFNGGPIDNPILQIRAKKVFPDVTAYVTVRGTLLQPQMSFSSDPPLTQSQIVSLILAGGSLDSAQSHGGNVALGQGVAMLAQEYGHLLGIQDASLESDINNETSVVLGRYLNPRLYVSYGVSLTEQLNTFKLRYTLGDHWTIKAEVGQAQGADLVYTIAK
jgi:translocation and assembly module TamB